MSWHAVDAVDDAVEATRRFLFPFSLVRWTVLALLVLLMGSTINTNVSLPFAPDARFTAFPNGGVPSGAMLGVDTAVLVFIGTIVAVVGVVVSVATLSLRLVFYDALRTNEIRVWGPFLARIRQAFGLFVFSVVVGLVVALPLLVAIVASTTIGWAPVDAFGDSVSGLFSRLPGWVLGIVLLFGAVVAVLSLLVTRFTYEFVVPVMVHRDDGVLSAWRRFWATLRESWTEFLLYLFVRFFLGVGVSIVETVVFLFAAGTVLLFGGVTLLIASWLLGGVSALTGTTVGVVIVVLVVLVAVLALLLVLLPVRLVTRTYLIMYEVSTLGGVDPALAMLDSAIAPATTGSPASGESVGPDER